VKRSLISVLLLGLLLSPGLANGEEAIEVKVTNVRDTAITVTWVSEDQVLGMIYYGVSPDRLDRVAYDDRGKDVKGFTHHITLRRLSPNTTYYFDVASGDTVYDNSGSHYKVTTASSIIPIGSDVIYGQVFKSYGVEVALDAIVYIKVVDKDGVGSSGESQEVSVPVGEHGFWHTDLVNVRSKDLKSLFEYSEIGDSIYLQVEAGPDGEASLQVDTSNDSPAPCMILEIPKDSK
jgi:hypothetical protein